LAGRDLLVRDLRIQSFDARLAAAKELARLKGHSKGGCEGIDVSHDGKYAASSSQDGTVRLWDVSSGKELKNGDNAAMGWMAEQIS
jgi:WD40 repeat protein